MIEFPRFFRLFCLEKQKKQICGFPDAQERHAARVLDMQHPCT